MRPHVGWYSKTEWMATFRPDGKGHILISGGSEPPEDIEVLDICCDICNSDAGVQHEDGSEGRIYYDADCNSSLCEPCGVKAEAQALDRLRQTLSARGWKPDEVKALSDDDLRDFLRNERLDLAVGVGVAVIAERLGWEVEDVTYFAARLLEEANVHDLAKVLFDSLRDEAPGAGGPR